MERLLPDHRPARHVGRQGPGARTRSVVVLPAPLPDVPSPSVGSAPGAREGWAIGSSRPPTSMPAGSSAARRSRSGCTVPP
ncbi:hypothetical protein ADK41_36480 [Streptomyces caelestis]|uniref:Uncharacterized protein n=1 Tax=Streptomyces caelestis TaxID=36816 RepID=A0A0M8QJ52_9ACTN|nr:hypothetical protein ADK41_36480 [Streptomyces caelestis]KOV31341.1 hypothetical protein ADK58_07130 [Streptomyces sp. XY152]